MKKLILALCIIAATSSVHAQKTSASLKKTKANTETAPATANAGVDKAAHKAKIIELLKSQVPTDNATDNQKKAFNEFFDCASDALVNNLSEEDLTSFENISNLPAEQQQAIGMKISPYLQPCGENLKKAFSESEGSGTPDAGATPAQ